MSVSFAFSQSNSVIEKIISSLSILVDGLVGSPTTENLVPDVFVQARDIVTRFNEFKAIDASSIKTTVSGDKDGRGTVIVFDIRSYNDSKPLYALAVYMTRYLMSLVSSSSTQADAVRVEHASMIKFVLVFVAQELQRIATVEYGTKKHDNDYPIVTSLKKLILPSTPDSYMINNLVQLVTNGNVVLLIRLADDPAKAVPLSIVILLYKFCTTFDKYQDFKLLIESLPPSTIQNFGAATKSKEFESTIGQFLPRFMLSIQLYLSTSIRIDSGVLYTNRQTLVQSVMPNTWSLHIAFLHYVSKMFAQEPLLASDPSFIWVLDKANKTTLVGANKRMALSSVRPDTLAAQAIISLEARSSTALAALVLGQIPKESSMLGSADTGLTLELFESRKKAAALEISIASLKKQLESLKISVAAAATTKVPVVVVNSGGGSGPIQLIPTVSNIPQMQASIDALKSQLTVASTTLQTERDRVRKLEQDNDLLIKQNKTQQLQLDAAITNSTDKDACAVLSKELVEERGRISSLETQINKQTALFDAALADQTTRSEKEQRELNAKIDQQLIELGNYKIVTRDSDDAFNKKSLEAQQLLRENNDLQRAQKQLVENQKIAQDTLFATIDKLTTERDEFAGKVSPLEIQLEDTKKELNATKLLLATATAELHKKAITVPPPSAPTTPPVVIINPPVKIPVSKRMLNDFYVPIKDLILASNLGAGSDASDWNISSALLLSLGIASDAVDSAAYNNIDMRKFSGVDKFRHLLEIYDMIFALIKSFFDKEANFKGFWEHNSYPGIAFYTSVQMEDDWEKNKVRLAERINNFVAQAITESASVRENITRNDMGSNLFMNLSEHLLPDDLVKYAGTMHATALFKALGLAADKNPSAFIMIKTLYGVIRFLRNLQSDTTADGIEASNFVMKSTLFDIKISSSSSSLSSKSKTRFQFSSSHDSNTMAASESIVIEPITTSGTMQLVVAAATARSNTIMPSRAPVSMVMSSSATASVHASSATPKQTVVLDERRRVVLHEAIGYAVAKKYSSLEPQLVQLIGDLKIKDVAALYDRRELVQLHQQIQSTPSIPMSLQLKNSELELAINAGNKK